MREMKDKVYAAWNIHCYCDCPHCGEYIDLMDSPDFQETIPHPGQNDEDHNSEYECSECHKMFIVDQIDY